jgi:hypothetical protein
MAMRAEKQYGARRNNKVYCVHGRTADRQLNGPEAEVLRNSESSVAAPFGPRLHPLMRKPLDVTEAEVVVRPLERNGGLIDRANCAERLIAHQDHAQLPPACAISSHVAEDTGPSVRYGTNFFRFRTTGNRIPAKPSSLVMPKTATRKGFDPRGAVRHSCTQLLRMACYRSSRG